MNTSAKLGATVALGILAVLVPVPASAEPAISKLPLPPGSSRSLANDINDHGVIVGSALYGNASHALRWNTDGTVTELGAVPDAPNSSATAVNSHGVAVGSAGNHAVRWAPDGFATRLPIPNGTKYCRALDINVHGVVVGRCGDQSNGMLDGRAVLWAANDQVTDLGTLPGDVAAYATGINDQSVVVGASVRNSLPRPARWSLFGMVTALAMPEGGASGEALGINNSGAIVGDVRITAPSRPSVDVAVRWTADGTATRLDGFSEGFRSGARGINSAGTTVGDATHEKDRQRHAARWELGPAEDIGTLPDTPRGSVTSASAVNDSGVIVGASGNWAVRWTS